MKNYLSRQILRSGAYPLLFVVILWMIFLVQTAYQLNLTGLGVLPREGRGLPGIATSVFIHGDINHIASNSIPIIVLGMMLFYFYRKIAKAAFVWMWLVSGLWLWIGGRNSISHPTFHIGASTLIYGLATFLFFSGIFRRHLQLMVVSALVLFLYGSIVWGVFPVKTEISWEGHLFGALAGVLVAFNYRREGPQRKVYDWEKEEDSEDETPPPGEEEPPMAEQPPQITIHYIYRDEKSSQDPGVS